MADRDSFLEEMDSHDIVFEERNMMGGFLGKDVGSSCRHFSVQMAAWWGGGNSYGLWRRYWIGDLGELDLGPGSLFTSCVTLGRSVSISDFGFLIYKIKEVILGDL